MKRWWVGGLVLAGMLLSGCTSLCLPDCARQSHFASSSSLVAFLYPQGEPPRFASRKFISRIVGYLTIVGAAILKGTRHDESTLIDLAVVDAPSRSLVLRAGGTDVRHASATLIRENRESREAGVAGFTAATAQMIEHFDSALTQFEADVRAGKANVRIVSRNAGVHTISSGGGGAFSWGWLLALAAARRRTARDAQ